MPGPDDSLIGFDTPPGTCAALSMAVNALAFVTRPDIWPQFIAYELANGCTRPDDEDSRQIACGYGFHMMSAHSSDVSQLIRAVMERLAGRIDSLIIPHSDN